MAWAEGQRPTPGNLLALPKSRYTEAHEDLRTSGACSAPDVPVSIFYSDHPVEQAKAKAICATCPVIDKCRQLAIDNNEWGLWGGMTDKGRRRYKEAQRRNARLQA